jgi:hypothetical protein
MAGKRAVDLVIFDAGEGQEYRNAGINSISVTDETLTGGERLKLQFTARNHSAYRMDNVAYSAEVRGEDRVDGFISIDPGAETAREAYLRVKPGAVARGRVWMTGDGLEEDNVKFFARGMPGKARALVVDGSPRPHSFDSESYYVEKALLPSGDVPSPISPRVVSLQGAEEEKLADYDCVLLLNAAGLSRKFGAELERYVEKGGGLFISLGDQSDPERPSKEIEALLPAQVWSVKESHQGTGMLKSAGDHPIASVLKPGEEELLRREMVRYYFLLKPSADRSFTTILHFTDGSPAMLEWRKGKGRVVLFTSTVDREWGDFAISTAFVPIIQKTAAYLAFGRGAEEDRGETIVNGTRKLTFAAKTDAVRVQAPRGTSTEVKARREGAVWVADFNGTDEPGIYSASAMGEQDAAETFFAVNVDPEEGNMTRVKMEDIAGMFDTGVRLQAPGAAGWTGAAGTRAVNLSDMLLFALILILLVEGVVAFL